MPTQKAEASFFQSPIKTGRMLLSVSIVPMFDPNRYTLDEYAEDSREVAESLRTIAAAYQEATGSAVTILRAAMAADATASETALPAEPESSK